MKRSWMILVFLHIGGSSSSFSASVVGENTQRRRAVVLLSTLYNTQRPATPTRAKAVTISSKLALVWSSSSVKTKERLQKLLFPEGVSYNVKKESFRTTKVNLLLSLNAELAGLSEEEIKKQGGIKTTLSKLVGMTLQSSNELFKDLIDFHETIESIA